MYLHKKKEYLHSTVCDLGVVHVWTSGTVKDYINLLFGCAVQPDDGLCCSKHVGFYWKTLTINYIYIYIYIYIYTHIVIV